ncbi:MAG: ATPase [Bacteroidales bacterium]|nr:ATPase [Bacteroidales bacterium]
MRKKIAIPLQQGVLCNHFGHCQQFAFFDTDKSQIVSEKLVTPPPHEPGLLPAWLAEQGVTDIIAGGMGQKALTLCKQQNIKKYIGVSPKSSKELVQDFLQNTLVTGQNACNH